MKKILIYCLYCYVAMSCFQLSAQEGSDLSSSLMLMYSPLDDSGKVASETNSIGKHHVGYAYAELSRLRGGNLEAYGQFFWEQKFWDKPIFLHAEYRGLAAKNFYESSAYLGAAYCLYSKHGYLALEPLAMWKQALGFGAQFSIVGEWEWKHVMLEQYTDLWKTHRTTTAMELYSETRLFVKLYQPLSAGLIATIFTIPDHAASRYGQGLYLALKCDL